MSAFDSAIAKFLARMHLIEFAIFVLLVAFSRAPGSSFENLIQGALGGYVVRLVAGQPIFQVLIEFLLIRWIRKHVPLIVMFSALASIVICAVLWGLGSAFFVSLFVPNFLGGMGIALYILTSHVLSCVITRNHAKALLAVTPEGAIP